MISNLVEEELWKIFTYYSLHGDSSQPEQLKPASFLKFCKDCQILSKKVNKTAIELEITKLARSKTGMNYKTNPAAITINFSDFFRLLDVLAQKIYPTEDPELTVKRLLMENVLLLSSRRIVANDVFDLDNLEANKLMKDTYGKAFQKIFSYYLDLATKRRNQIIATEQMLLRDMRILRPEDILLLQDAKRQELHNLKEFMKVQKDVIGYKEYMQFCHDFHLKSTSLLTAMQVAEVYFNLVPIPLECPPVSNQPNSSIETAGMSLEAFQRSVLYLACLAYRESTCAHVSTVNKVKALFSFMWKIVNDQDKNTRMIHTHQFNTASAFAAGSLNIYQSRIFSDVFLQHWTKDGFADYLSADVQLHGNSATVIKNVIGEGGNEEESISPTTPMKGGSSSTKEGSNLLITIGSPPPPKSDQAIMQALQKSLIFQTNAQSTTRSVASPTSTTALDTTATAAAGGNNNQPTTNSSSSSSKKTARRTNSIYVTHFTDNIHSRSYAEANPADTYSSNNSSNNSNNGNSGAGSGKRKLKKAMDGTVLLTGMNVRKLLMMKPELSEYLHMEIMNMKVMDD